jgi:hypothetical protein
MSFVIGVNTATSLVQYNQASAALSYNNPVPRLHSTIPSGQVGEPDPQPVQPVPASQDNSLNAELAAGLLEPNANLDPTANPNNPVSAAANGSPLVSLGAAAQAISTGQTFQYYNAMNQVDDQSVPSVYDPTTPVYNFPTAYMQRAYTQSAQQTPPSTSSQELRQTLASSITGHNYGNF